MKPIPSVAALLFLSCSDILAGEAAFSVITHLNGNAISPATPSTATGKCRLDYFFDPYLDRLDRFNIVCSTDLTDATGAKLISGMPTLTSQPLLDIPVQAGSDGRHFALQGVLSDQQQSRMLLDNGNLYAVIQSPRHPEGEIGGNINGPCGGTVANNLCINNDRFKVTVNWTDFQDNKGNAVPSEINDNSGLFFFFSAANWELMIKVLDGCAANEHFWVFAAATTNVEYTLTVTDTQSNTVKEYSNPLGQVSPAITDTSAFATCP